MSNPVKFHFSPYGSASAALEEIVKRNPPHADWLRAALNRRPSRRSESRAQFWIIFSQELDAGFVKRFRERSTPDARLLVMNALGGKQLTDNFFTHLMELQIRSEHRLYVADWPGTGSAQMRDCLAAFMQRFAAASNVGKGADRILNAAIFAGVMHVASTEFKRLEIPLAKIPALATLENAAAAEFEIDEDGSFLYWPKLDLHLGWEQLAQIVNPAAALKARQKQAAFNVWYGQSVQRLREQAGIKADAITGLSGKQLGRIERGECRLTSNAIEIMAKAHKLSPNEYLKKLAENLSHWPAPAFRNGRSGSVPESSETGKAAAK